MKTKLQKAFLFFLIPSVLLLGGGYATYRGYKSVRQTRLVKQARSHMAKSDPKKALLVLQQALRYNPRDVEASRLMADLAEAGGSPAAIVWRSRVADSRSASLEDRLALAQTAMKFGDFASATNALDKVDPAGQKTAAYHNVAGSIAIGARQPAQAERHFVEASRLEPQNPLPQLNLSVIRLYGTNGPALEESRRTLKRISVEGTNSALRAQALRELAVDAMRQGQTEAALNLTQQLIGETNSLFQDRLLRLQVLREGKKAEFKPALAAFQAEAASQPVKIYELATWQLANTSVSETLAWLLRLPVGIQTNPPVSLLVAECHVLLKNWAKLQSTVEVQNWGDLDFIRHAFKAHALREQSLTAGAKSEWELCLKAANNQKSSLSMLLRLAASWNWESEGEELLWTIVNRYPDEKWAFQVLNRTLFLNGRTRPLMMLYSQELKRSPTDLAMKNNLAMTALLLEAKELKPHDLAREAYQKAPTNSSYVSTYAFSLYLQGKNSEALKVMQSLKPKDLEDPQVAGYYGLILKATGDKAGAGAYLGWAFRAQMLPEEKKLFEQGGVGL